MFCVSTLKLKLQEYTKDMLQTSCADSPNTHGVKNDKTLGYEQRTLCRNCWNANTIYKQD